MREPRTHKMFGARPVCGAKGGAVPVTDGEGPTCRKCLAWVRAANRSYREPQPKAPKKSAAGRSPVCAWYAATWPRPPTRRATW